MDLPGQHRESDRSKHWARFIKASLPASSFDTKHAHRSSRSRSRSPTRHKDSHHHRHPHRHHHHHHRHHRHQSDRDDKAHDKERDHHHHRETKERQKVPLVLPFEARQLTKHDLKKYRPLFGSYLDIQKELDIDELDDLELKGRWKSFVGKWNRGELAEGWYDPQVLKKAMSSELPSRRRSPSYEDMPEDNAPPSDFKVTADDGDDEDDDDDGYGPTIPADQRALALPPSSRKAPGPTNPTTQDIRVKHEEEHAQREADWEDRKEMRTLERKQARAEAKELQEEVAPRAEPGTRERRLEKKREAAASNRAFAESRRGGSPVPEVGDEELMGSGGGSDFARLKREKELQERKKSDRELRREEILRARIAEREERMRNYRQREEQTISMFKALAKQRFGESDDEEVEERGRLEPYA